MKCKMNRFFVLLAVSLFFVGILPIGNAQGHNGISCFFELPGGGKGVEVGISSQGVLDVASFFETCPSTGERHYLPINMDKEGHLNIEISHRAGQYYILLQPNEPVDLEVSDNDYQIYLIDLVPDYNSAGGDLVFMEVLESSKDRVTQPGLNFLLPLVNFDPPQPGLSLVPLIDVGNNNGKKGDTSLAIPLLSTINSKAADSVGLKGYMHNIHGRSTEDFDFDQTVLILNTKNPNSISIDGGFI